MDKFVSLHTHTHYSPLDGFSTPSEYVKTAVELGQPGIGITDHGSLGGIYESLNAANSLDSGFKVVPGIEIYVAPENPEGAKVKKSVFYGSPEQRRLDVSSNGAYLHMTVWAKNQTGLTNLFRLNNLAWLKEHYYYKPRIDWEMLVEHSEGLIVATGCPSSEISTRLRLGQFDVAKEKLGNLIDVFGYDNVFFEVMNHEMSIDLEERLIKEQLKLHKVFPKLRFLATNDAHYAKHDDSKHHEELLCNQSGCLMSEPPYDEGGKRFAFNSYEFYLKTAEQMQRLFPEDTFPGAISNTIEFLDQVDNINVDFNPHLKPKPIIPEKFSNEVDYFKFLVRKGLEEKYPKETTPVDVRKRAEALIKKEFEVIHSSDFIGYFEVVQDYIAWSNNNHGVIDPKTGELLVPATGPGRGSAGGCILAYLLGIVDIDPVRWDLIFERFMTSGRGATYEITLEDGESLKLLASDKLVVQDSKGKKTKKYVHELDENESYTVIEVL